MTIIFNQISDDKYESEEGQVFQRELEFHDHWVLRDSKGNIIDSDQYRHDLAERQNILLHSPTTLQGLIKLRREE